jgi:zinc protease
VKYLGKNARVVVYGVPGEPVHGPDVPAVKTTSKEGGESVNADEPWREKPPVPGPDPRLAFPTLESFQLSNGLTVILDSRKGLPVIAASLDLRGGIAANPPDKPGLAAFMLDMLDEGTTTRSALEYAEQLKQAGVSVSTVAGRDYSGVVLSATKGTMSTGFDLMADAVLNPAFAEKEVERLRKTRLGELSQLKEDPGQVADITTILALNGKENPYGYPGLGTEASVSAITVNDLKTFWQEQTRPANAVLVISGDATKEELTPILEKSFGKWTGPAPSAITLPEPVVKRRVVLVNAPGAPQTQVRVVLPGPRRSSPDYAALLTMNEILGGAFSSRINMNIREQHGYSYGANTWTRTLAYGGWIVAGAGVRTAVTAPAVLEMVKEMDQMGKLPVKPEEIRLAKSSLVRSFPSWFETTGQTVNILSEIPVYNLGLDYYPQYAKQIDAITEADVQNVAKKYLFSANMIVIAVGDRKAIEPGLKSGGFGDIEVRDKNGNVQ